MPSIVIFGVWMALLLGWILGAWTLGQAMLNHRAVKGHEDLRKVTREKVLRIAGLFSALTFLTIAGALSILPPPRPTIARFTISLGLVLGVLAVAGLSVREFLDMRRQLSEGEDY